MNGLEGMKVAVLVTDGFEEIELTEPVAALREAGARVDILSPGGKPVQAFRHADKGGFHHADGDLERVDASAYDGVLLPGGALNADKLRMNEHARAFVRTVQAEQKPIAAICHAPWLLISSGLIRDRTVTAYYTLQDDIRNAGGRWIDREVVRDGLWVTSRKPKDIPAFNAEMLRVFAACNQSGIHRPSVSDEDWRGARP